MNEEDNPIMDLCSDLVWNLCKGDRLSLAGAIRRDWRSDTIMFTFIGHGHGITNVS